jgi:hypothetical protein
MNFAVLRHRLVFLVFVYRGLRRFGVLLHL